MLLALIAAATPALCPGDLAYHREVSRAASLLGVTQQLYIEVVPNELAPAANVKGKPQKAIAWIKRGKAFDKTIRIRYDMLHAMSCDALRLSALHEVCHIALGHHRVVVSHEIALQEEEAVDECVKKKLKPGEWERFNSDVTSAYWLAQRERIAPPK